jgi:hypothetical protein
MLIIYIESETHLHQIIYLLEYATQRSPQNYQFRLILIRIYRLLGLYLFILMTQPILILFPRSRPFPIYRTVQTPPH